MDQEAEVRTAYRAFTIDDRGHLGGVPQIIVARDDLEAARQAESFADHSAVEIWQGARLVTRLRPCHGGRTHPAHTKLR